MLLYALPQVGQVTLAQAVEHWQNAPAGLLYGFAPTFVFFADGAGRLAASATTSSFNATQEPPLQPVQRLYLDGNSEKRLSELTRRAFGVGLYLDRFSGNTLPLRLGTAPSPPVDGVPTIAYVEETQANPTIEQQGDGMRSFVGILLNVVVGSHAVTIIDEPEAFLHPPQARLLGQLLVTESAGQTVVATHDSDFLQGLLSVEADLTVVRLTRDGSINHAAVLDPVQVKELWSDPLLRYSNVLDGLFHELVVVCEGDADCRFYQAVLEAMTAVSSTQDASTLPKRPDVLFSHCGGKDRIHVAVSALAGVKVKVHAVADFDVLREEAQVKRIVEALNGNWLACSKDWRMVKQALDSSAQAPTVDYVKSKVTELLSGDSGPITEAQKKEIKSAIKTTTGWDRVKEGGVSAVPNGEARSAFDRLNAYLRSVGLYVVLVGELEKFVPQVDLHGPRWVTQVLAERRHLSPDLIDARQFVNDAVLGAI